MRFSVYVHLILVNEDMKYSFPLIALLLFAATQGFSTTFDDDPYSPGETNLVNETNLDDAPPWPLASPLSEPLQPQQPSVSPPQPLRPTTADSQVRSSLRSQIDPDHPFSQLRFDTIDPNSRITGQPLTVCEMLEPVSSPQTRCQLLHAYWSLSGELAKYKLAIAKQNQLSQWAGKYGATGAKSTVFQAAEKQAVAQRNSIELRVILKQTEFAALLRQTGYYRPIVQANQSAAEQLPIPCDLPFIGVYQTHVNQLVQYRPASNLVLLDKAIALRRQIFEAKCEEFNAMDELFSAIQNSETSVESLIQANNEYYATYAECIDAIVAYNETIAEYVALTVGPEISGRRLLMTLLRLNPEQNSIATGSTEDPANSVPVVPPEDGF